MEAVDVLSVVFGSNGEHVQAAIDAPSTERGLIWSAIDAYKEKPPEWAETLRIAELIQKEEKWGYVYVIRGTHGGIERMKIGKANDLSDRLRLFAVKLPFDIETVSAFYVPEPLRTERALHLMMSDCRVSGEWFDLDAARLKKVQWAGFAAEADAWAACFERVASEYEKSRQLPSAEYIEYLEALLAMNQITFHRCGVIKND
jgi:hypothetical protein